jgi:hypothetical protein
MAFRNVYIELWPAAGKGPRGPAGSYSRRYAWPECWQDHAGLVTELHTLKSWTEALETGNLTGAAAYGGGYDEWIRHVREVTAPMVQEIGRVCMAGDFASHVDMSVPLRGREHRHRPRWHTRRHPSPTGHSAVAVAGVSGP